MSGEGTEFHLSWHGLVRRILFFSLKDENVIVDKGFLTVTSFESFGYGSHI